MPSKSPAFWYSGQSTPAGSASCAAVGAVGASDATSRFWEPNAVKDASVTDTNASRHLHWNSGSMQASTSQPAVEHRLPDDRQPMPLTSEMPRVDMLREHS